MKQKLVLKMQMDCEKCRNKALKTAAEVAGVTSISLEGDAKDNITVIGDDVDLVCLANSLKKKFRTLTIVSVENVKSAAEKKVEEDKKKEEEKKKREDELKKCRELLGPKCSHSCCDDTLKCHGLKCDDMCTCKPTCTKCDVTCTCITTYTKCVNTINDGHCFSICMKCQNSKCPDMCKPKPCSKCKVSKYTGECKTKPPSLCYQTCPPWCTCPKCYVPYPNPVYSHYPPNYMIAYDQPDSCSIM